MGRKEGEVLTKFEAVRRGDSGLASRSREREEVRIEARRNRGTQRVAGKLHSENHNYSSIYIQTLVHYE